jgi:type VI secretion system protein ImpK
MRLSDCYMELVAYVAYFLKSVTKKQQPFEQVRSRVEGMLSAAYIEAVEAFGGEDADLARFAVCAWIDEAILSSGWNEKPAWQKEPLQLKYYQTLAAGENFFEKLNALGPQNNDAREVYYLCLAMGFMGRYCKEGDKFLLEQLKTSNLKVLMGSSAGIPTLKKTQLFPEAYPPAGSVPVKVSSSMGTGLFNIILVAVPVALFGLLYGIYYFVLSNIAKTLVP